MATEQNEQPTNEAIEGEIVDPQIDDPAAFDPITIASELGHKDRRGRPSEMTIEVVGKLMLAFHNGFNITEACIHAGIGRQTYYDWLARDDFFSYKMSQAQSSVGRRAKVIIAQAIRAGDVNTARWWLNARDPEFKAKGEITPPEGQETTEKKLKEFMDDTDDGAYPSAADAQSEQSSTEISTESGVEVAPGPTDIS